MSYIPNTGIDSRKLGMWVVIGSECMLFGCLIVNYILSASRVIRSTEPGLIKPIEILNILVTSTSTFVLLMSSLAMVLALAGLQDNDLARFRKWCFVTAFLGAIFLGFQVYEFTEFYLKGFGFRHSVYSAAFFTLTGTHGAHVLVGVILLTSFGLWSYWGKISSKKHSVVLETIGLYWHFVDVIWIIIFTVVYLFILAPHPY
jgi:heme/copper-type cytochrome/quinol oxidase subunit 3